MQHPIGASHAVKSIATYAPNASQNSTLLDSRPGLLNNRIDEGVISGSRS